MFRTDHSMMMPWPAALFGWDENVVQYPLFESARPGSFIWIVRVAEKSDDDEPGLQRKIFVDNIEGALSILTLDSWTEESTLYLIVPEGRTKSGLMEMSVCHDVWECLETGATKSFWLFETDGGLFFEGGGSTQSFTKRQVWKSSK